MRDSTALPSWIQDHIESLDGTLIGFFQHEYNEDGCVLVIEVENARRYLRTRHKYGEKPEWIAEEDAREFAIRHAPERACKYFSCPELDSDDPDQLSAETSASPEPEPDEGFRDLEVHDLCKLVPRLSPPDRRALKESIVESGGLGDAPIVLYEGKILDGRHRYEICIEEELPLDADNFTDFEGDQEEARTYVQKQVTHRHLNVAEKAALAVSLFLEEEREAARQRQQSGSDLRQNSTGGRATEVVGRRVGVSRNSVERVKKLKTSAPHVFEDIMRGRYSSISEAERSAELDEATYEEARRAWENQDVDKKSWDEATDSVRQDVPEEVNAAGEDQTPSRSDDADENKPDDREVSGETRGAGLVSDSTNTNSRTGNDPTPPNEVESTAETSESYSRRPEEITRTLRKVANFVDDLRISKTLARADEEDVDGFLRILARLRDFDDSAPSAE